MTGQIFCKQRSNVVKLRSKKYRELTRWDLKKWDSSSKEEAWKSKT